MMGTCSNSPAAIDSRKAASISGRSSTSQHTSTMTVVGISRGLSADSRRAAQRAWWVSERSMAATSGPVSSSVVTRGASDARG